MVVFLCNVIPQLSRAWELLVALLASVSVARVQERTRGRVAKVLVGIGGVEWELRQKKIQLFSRRKDLRFLQEGWNVEGHLGELVVVIIIIWCWTLNNGQSLKKWDEKISKVESTHRLGPFLVKWAVGGREGGAERQKISPMLFFFENYMNFFYFYMF